MSETKDKLRGVRGTVLEIASKYLSADEISARMDDVFSIDSLDLIEIVVDIEQTYQITFANEEVQSIENFDELIVMIHRKLEGLDQVSGASVQSGTAEEKSLNKNTPQKTISYS